MKLAVLDTNILVHYLKKSMLVQEIQSYLLDNEYVSVLSAVTKAELLAIAEKNMWGEQRKTDLNLLFDQFIYIDIQYNNNELLMAYATIDAYSQGKISSPNGHLLNNTSRNMGKNDLWIAATAYAMNAMLLTTDGDFDHLDKSFINLKKYAL